MSKFASGLVNGISPYVPGEQPRDKKYIKLNTNENPYYTSSEAVERITKGVLEGLNRYSDPECTTLTQTIAEYYGVKSENVLVTNGSDEALAFAFFAYGGNGVCYPDVTYGFYDVIANLFGCKVTHFPLKDDFTVDERDYYNSLETVVLANPNAQTGIALDCATIEKIVLKNQNNVVIIDQAYADFGQFNAIGLVKKYNNLVVVNTFSKSRSLAGARVGFIIADSALIEDLKKVKNSFHPYNVNSVSAALAAAAINDHTNFYNSIKKIKETRERLTCGLKSLGFTVLPSEANFVMAKIGSLNGEELYRKLKDNGVLVRHFSDERISDFVRISIGTDEEINVLLGKIEKILKEIV